MGKYKENKRKPVREGKLVTVGKIEDVPPGRGATVKLKDGKEVAVFNANGKFGAVENFCPHKAVPIADSPLHGDKVECKLHGWRFNVFTGACSTKKNCSIEAYEVTVEDGWIKILI